MAKRRIELSASGIDDGRLNLSTDPWTAGSPQGPGLRVPSVLTHDTPSTRPRYLFMLATRVIMSPCRLIGIRQGLTIGNFLVADSPEARAMEFTVVSPTFNFVDGNVSWHLVYEDNVQPNPHEMAITDAANWAKDCTTSPAMLYSTFTNTVVNVNGAPILYMDNLTAYTPPQLQNSWKPVAHDLKCFYDIRFPYESHDAWAAFGGDGGIELETGRRVSLYASILQTNPATRADAWPAIGTPPNQEAPNGLPPEEAFITLMESVATGESAALGAIYWRVLGALIFEDEIADVAGRG